MTDERRENQAHGTCGAVACQGGLYTYRCKTTPLVVRTSSFAHGCILNPEHSDRSSGETDRG